MDAQAILSLIWDFLLLNVQVTLALLCELYKLFVPPAEKNVRDRLVLITGAGGSLGREIALQLSAKGAKIVLTDVNEKDLTETRKIVEGKGGEVYSYTCDITKPENVRQLADKVSLQVGQVSMLFHCAGIYIQKAFLQHTEKDIENIIRVNVLGTMWVTKAFLGPMWSSNSGDVVLLSSVLGVMGRSNLAPYCASKFSITGFADALTQELRENSIDGVTLTIVHPFLIGNITDVTVNIRIPGIFDILTPTEAARRIIEGVRQGQEEIYLPGKLKPLIRMNRLLPRKIRQICQRFVEDTPEA